MLGLDMMVASTPAQHALLAPSRTVFPTQPAAPVMRARPAQLVVPAVVTCALPALTAQLAVHNAHHA